MCRTYYTVDMVHGTGRVDKEFETYEEAYDYMCRNYMRELNAGYKPTLYKILKHDVSTWGGSTNTLVQPAWS